VVCALVNAGNFGTIDTARRLQVARWIRLGEPPVSAADAAGGFGITGRDGERHAWYGIGQSLLLLPIDAVVSATVVPTLSRFGLDPVRREQIVELVIAFVMQWLVTSCSLVLAYKILRSFQFTHEASVKGALALLFGTLYLQYVQCAQENNLLLLLALCALYAVRRWQHGSGAQWAAAAGTACGFAILVRLSSVLDAIVLVMFAVSAGSNGKRFLAGFLPPVTAALLFDRWYHWERFGELSGTYMGVFGRQYRPAGAPSAFPFSYPFWKGFLGTLFGRDKSIFLFDPLLVVLLLVVLWKWGRICHAVRAAVRWLAVLLLAYTCLYARFYVFGGDVAWGHRYVTMPVQLLCLFSVPLLLTVGKALPTAPRLVAWTLVWASIVLQTASTTMAPNVEVLQRDRGYRSGVIAGRAVNLAQIALHENSSRFEGIPAEWRSLYYFPFQLRFRYPLLANWAIALWLALLACLPFLLWAAFRYARLADVTLGP
jgi:hypothetical protein